MSQTAASGRHTRESDCKYEQATPTRSSAISSSIDAGSVSDPRLHLSRLDIACQSQRSDLTSSRVSSERCFEVVRSQPRACGPERACRARARVGWRERPTSAEILPMVVEGCVDKCSLLSSQWYQVLQLAIHSILRAVAGCPLTVALAWTCPCDEHRRVDGTGHATGQSARRSRLTVDDDDTDAHGRSIGRCRSAAASCAVVASVAGGACGRRAG